MGSLHQYAVDGFNETLASIKAAQVKYPDTQQHFVSLVLFSTGPLNFFLDKVTATNADPMKMEDFKPSGGTALFDAIEFYSKHAGTHKGYYRLLCARYSYH